jgi:predicted SAM-dependent methyltransferase
MEVTRNEKLRLRSQRFPYRQVLGVVPLHVVREVAFESRLAWLRMTRRGVDTRFADAEDLLVNVGCGSSGLAGWVNIDCFPAEGVTCVRDCRTSLPLPTDSARGIFTEHFLEHLDYYEEAPRFLEECRRVLQPGGLLRVIVPDGAKYLHAYDSGDMSSMRAFSPLVSMDASSDDRPFSSHREIVPFRTKMEVVNFHFRQSGQHRFSYDDETLSALLLECGFEGVNRREFRSSSLADLEIDSEFRSAESLAVEGMAPR